jgi:hypothetical protein
MPRRLDRQLEKEPSLERFAAAVYKLASRTN